MSNPYSSPSSDLVEVKSNNISNFKRFSAWGVFGLSVITLGIYFMYWIINRSLVLNGFYHQKISPIFIWGSLITYLVYMPFSQLIDKLSDQTILLAVGFLISLGYLVLYVGLVFAFRNRLLEMAREDGRSDFKIGPVLTFFFQALYLQFKINQYIDGAKA
jgi:hypothetical protein